MLHHQLLKTLPSKSHQDTRVLGLWLFPITSELKPISVLEEKWSQNLPTIRQREYKYSRGYARYALANLFQIDPLQIPLNSPPGKAPELANGWGHISMSHCNDALLIGWSINKIGVDIESSNRNFNAKGIAKRFFCNEEQEDLITLNNDLIHKTVLSKWVIKESAIKWQQGSIYKDFTEWISNKSFTFASHRSLKLKTDVELIKYKFWHIGIAYDKKNISNTPMLCIN